MQHDIDTYILNESKLSAEKTPSLPSALVSRFSSEEAQKSSLKELTKLDDQLNVY
jgi:hypothetical protein